MSWPRAAFRGLNALATVAFLLFAAVQYNDPDPVRWMAIYLAAALSCALAVMGRLRWPLPALAAAAALAWAGVWAPRVVGQVDWGHAFAGAGMSGDVKEEEARELGGLLIVAAWCALLALASLPGRRGTPGTGKGVR
ncbi:MAG TPA: transmembrane 220 family protein [Myxococcales bacterium]|nr:transmembrane 220 family protein [Myxococcales bacterium]